jgi:hypothetical protein
MVLEPAKKETKVYKGPIEMLYDRMELIVDQDSLNRREMDLMFSPPVKPRFGYG